MIKKYKYENYATFNKTHFKGLESLSVKPKEIYDLFKKEEFWKNHLNFTKRF